MENENKGEIIIYQSDDGIVQLDVRLENETVWLTIDQMALLFGKSRSTINEHILNVFQSGELNESDSVRKIGNSDFSTKPTNFYNLTDKLEFTSLILSTISPLWSCQSGLRGRR